METETRSSAPVRFMNENEKYSEPERRERLLGKLMRFYSVLGGRPEEPGSLSLLAEILVTTASDADIDAALTRCARECRYPVRLPEILQRIPGHEVPQPEAEARKAWDEAVNFADRWVQSDVEGNYVISSGVRSEQPPKLSQRIMDTVRRTGRWRALKTMRQEDYPHQKKRFLDEYLAWMTVERIDTDHMLMSAVVKQLATAKAMETTGQGHKRVT